MSPPIASTDRRGLIAVMGATGSGKSSFVNAILGKDVAAVGDGLESLTAEVAQYPYTHRNQTEVRVVDAPGFNDFKAGGSKTDTKVLQMIGAFLKKEYEADQKFSGIIFLHNINMNASSIDWKTQRRNIALFKKLCGSESMKNVVVVTTFWDQLASQDQGLANEEKLKTEPGLLQELRDSGSKFVRYGHFGPEDQPKSDEFMAPHDIVDHLLGLEPVFVDMQKEMASGSTIAQTGAGSLIEDFKRLKLDTENALSKMGNDIATANKDHEEWAGKMSAAWLNGVGELEEHRKQVARLEALVYQHQTQVNVLDREVAELRKTDRQRITQLTEELDRVRKEKGVLQTIMENGLLERLNTLPESIVDAVQKADSQKVSLREQVARLRPFEKMHEEMRRSHDELVETNKNLRIEADRLRKELHNAQEHSTQLQSELEALRGRILAAPDVASDASQTGQLISQFSLFTVLFRLLSLRYWISPSAIQRA